MNGLVPFRSPNFWPGLGFPMISHSHLPFMHYDYEPGMRDPYWSLDPYVDRCCDLCDAWQEFVGHVSPYSPPSHATYSQT
jgi:hypothetical protein